MLLSDVAEAWEMRKPEEGFMFTPFLGPSQSRRGESEHHGDHPSAAGSVGLEENWEAFQGALDPLGGTHLGPGRQLASCNPAISRQRSWVVVVVGAVG